MDVTEQLCIIDDPDRLHGLSIACVFVTLALWLIVALLLWVY